MIAGGEVSHAVMAVFSHAMIVTIPVSLVIYFFYSGRMHSSDPINFS